MVLAEVKPQSTARDLHVHRHARLKGMLPINGEAEKSAVELFCLLHGEDAQDGNSPDESNLGLRFGYRGAHGPSMNQNASSGGSHTFYVLPYSSRQIFSTRKANTRAEYNNECKRYHEGRCDQ